MVRLPRQLLDSDVCVMKLIPDHQLVQWPCPVCPATTVVQLVLLPVIVSAMGIDHPGHLTVLGPLVSGHI
jgi:hypothetical protein